ncbi:hypothetical protein X777_16048 [Ooceraea biroi]|uniref:Uncharacterized protein n=1 Tax=Ooceraea biroi TaxID=2015173 RepID=A0A026WVY0_OOCBI|nr:hypothetical protein X777_16048 [Ooceraea biroi]
MWARQRADPKRMPITLSHTRPGGGKKCTVIRKTCFFFFFLRDVRRVTLLFDSMGGRGRERRESLASICATDVGGFLDREFLVMNLLSSLNRRSVGTEVCLSFPSCRALQKRDHVDRATLRIVEIGFELSMPSKSVVTRIIEVKKKKKKCCRQNREGQREMIVT